MADVHDQKTRSYNMSRIKGKDTKPEMIVRKFFYVISIKSYLSWMLLIITFNI
jgi:DNA mismatch endonuclease (patch repair protein)